MSRDAPPPCYEWLSLQLKVRPVNRVALFFSFLLIDGAVTKLIIGDTSIYSLYVSR